MKIRRLRAILAAISFLLGAVATLAQQLQAVPAGEAVIKDLAMFQPAAAIKEISFADAAETREKKDAWLLSKDLPPAKNESRGEMILWSDCQTKAPTIRLNPKLKGWRAIYAGIYTPAQSLYSGLDVSLSNAPSVPHWSVAGVKASVKKSESLYEEVFCGKADMTDQSIVIDQPEGCDSYLTYLRFVPLSKEEIEKEELAAKEKKFEFGVWMDHFDYTVDVPDPGKWHTQESRGVHRIVRYCLEIGATAIYWRDFAGALIRHKSKTEEGQYPRKIDKRRTVDMRSICGDCRYGECKADVIAEAARWAHHYGVKLYVYHTWEDIHGIPCFLGRFALEHPQYWEVRRDGSSYPSRLSTAYPEVRRYRLALIQEMLDRGVDGLFFDFTRQSGWAGWQGGYEKIILDAYKEKHGADPATLDPQDEKWVRFRASYLTQFFRELKELLAKQDRKIEVIVAIPNITKNPRDALYARGTDWVTWVEEGLIDGFAPNSVSCDRKNPLESYYDTMAAIKKIAAGRCKIYWPLKFYWGVLGRFAKDANLTVDECVTKLITKAREEGAAGMHLPCYDHDSAGTMRGTIDAELRARIKELLR